ncbi:MAG: hypothetical protein A3D38_02250 [Candidatus Portnoybacteria bacterium RIFCSPHIGHO2_02_FULL_40_23]|nr:MAG: hypothetical protein A3D38_02250 [Candidatus Portnoybacteria bacterium RIFCSPHIGHO2_02_FULL_40_23]
METENLTPQIPLEPKPPSSFTKFATIFGIVLVVAIAVGATFYFKSSKPVNIDIVEESTKSVSDVVANGKISGQIYFIKEGDLWRIDANGENAAKLIDLDTLNGVALSPNKNNVAYTRGKKINELVTEYDGTKHEIEVEKNELLVADSKGTNSISIFNNVGQWGWISGTNLLWYETATLQQYFDWGYMGDGNIWIINLENKKADKFIEEKEVRRPQWSPDGDKLLFISTDELKVADRKTKSVTTIFKIPYVGGDRGGPAPVPAFHWAPDSTGVYTIFSAHLGGTTNTYQLKSEHVTAIKIGLGGEITKLMPDKPSPILNEETYPRANFSDGFNKIIYPRFADANKSHLVLAMYDRAEAKEYVLLENTGKAERGLLEYGKDLSLTQENYAYIIVGDGDWLYKQASVTLKKINYQSSTSEDLALLKNIGDTPVWNLHLSPKQETLFFTMGGGLYIMSKSGVQKIVENLGDFGDIQYYLE